MQRNLLLRNNLHARAPDEHRFSSPVKPLGTHSLPELRRCRELVRHYLGAQHITACIIGQDDAMHTLWCLWLFLARSGACMLSLQLNIHRLINKFIRCLGPWLQHDLPRRWILCYQYPRRIRRPVPELYIDQIPYLHRAELHRIVRPAKHYDLDL